MQTQRIEKNSGDQTRIELSWKSLYLTRKTSLFFKGDMFCYDIFFSTRLLQNQFLIPNQTSSKFNNNQGITIAKIEFCLFSLTQLFLKYKAFNQKNNFPSLIVFACSKKGLFQDDQEKSRHWAENSFIPYIQTRLKKFVQRNL